GLFSKCSVCERPLLEGESLYEIQKVFRGTEVVFEYAVCQPCGMNLMKSYSKESIRTLQEFFETRFHPDDDHSHCHFCGAERLEGKEDVSILALCLGNLLVTPPVVICGACNESINEKLSKKTRESYGDFIETYFPGVPAGWEAPVPFCH
ncbi:MAG: hypothetical protein ACYTHM_21375, partial [Planctomycetota bacterium]